MTPYRVAHGQETVYIPDDLLAVVGSLGGGNLSHEFQQFLRERLVHGYEQPRPPIPVRDLVPYAHVSDLAESIDFYTLLGFYTLATVGGRGQQTWWALMQADRGRLMLASATERIDAQAQAVLFYLYTDDLAGLRKQLLSASLEPSSIRHPPHMPAGEMRLHDPDGYVLLIGQQRPKP